MFKKNEVINDVKIIDYTYEGLGIAKVNNFAIFILYAKLNETYNIKITKIEKNYAYAMITDKNDLHVKCEHYKTCGGCQIMHLNYDEQLEFKYNLVNNLKNKYKIDTTVNKVVKNNNPFNYRNKVQMPFSKDSEGNIYCGFYKKRSHDVIKVNYCHLQSKLVNELTKYICELLNEVKETVYDEDKHRGNLRHLYIRESQINNELMVVFVCNSNQIKDQKYVVKQITSKFKQVKAVVINENKRQTNAVLGFKNYNLYNSNFITENLNDLQYRISPNVFFQVNTLQAITMYELVVDYLNLNGSEIVLDAYCGTGSISLFLSKYAKLVYGIEIVKPAIDSANVNMKQNNITNCEFICGDINKVIPTMTDVKFDAVVVDPPRKGLDSKFIETMLNTKPSKIVYVSCNPDTLMRDLQKFSELYTIEFITPVDMFSQTYHVECITKLILKEK